MEDWNDELGATEKEIEDGDEVFDLFETTRGDVQQVTGQKNQTDDDGVASLFATTRGPDADAEGMQQLHTEKRVEKVVKKKKSLAKKMN